jgi:hypothetical protein
MLQAMRHLMIKRKQCRGQVVHNEMTQEELTRILEHVEEEEKILDMALIPPPLPDKFSLFRTKWHAFAEGFKGHFAIAHGSMNIPLVYMLRDH